MRRIDRTKKKKRPSKGHGIKKTKKKGTQREDRISLPGKRAVGLDLLTNKRVRQTSTGNGRILASAR